MHLTTCPFYFTMFRSQLQRSSALRGPRRQLFGSIISAANELRAVQSLIGILKDCLNSQSTTIEEDEALLEDIQAYEKDSTSSKRAVGVKNKEQLDGIDGEGRWRLQCAVTYRLTRKRILLTTLRKLAVVETHFKRRCSNRDSVSTSGRDSEKSRDAPDGFGADALMAVMQATGTGGDALDTLTGAGVRDRVSLENFDAISAALEEICVGKGDVSKSPLATGVKGQYGFTDTVAHIDMSMYARQATCSVLPGHLVSEQHI
jgi:Rubisco LSMT substrate-binding